MAKYELPELDYAYDALEPHISGEIMELHHSKHHANYVNGANAALEKLAAAAAAHEAAGGAGPLRVRMGDAGLVAAFLDGLGLHLSPSHGAPTEAIPGNDHLGTRLLRDMPFPMNQRNHHERLTICLHATSCFKKAKASVQVHFAKSSAYRWRRFCSWVAGSSSSG